MARSNFDPEADWTSEGLGWVLCFVTRPDGLDDLPAGGGPGTKGEALRNHFQQCFTHLEEMLEAGIIITDRNSTIGFVSVIGQQEACERLKQKVEAAGFAHMCKDMPYFVPA